MKFAPATQWLPNRNRLPSTSTIAPHILLLVMQILALAAPPIRLRRSISVILIILLIIPSFLNSPFTSDIGAMQPWSLMWPNWLSEISHIMFSEPDQDVSASFWHTKSLNFKVNKKCRFSMLKIPWAMTLLVNLRGVRWNFQVRNIPV